MTKRLFILCLILLISSFVYAIDDQAVLKVKINEALQYERSGNSLEAENQYKQLLENFPHNRQVISRLVFLYLRTNDLDDLEQLLDNEKDYLTSNYYEITRIELLIKKNELEKARDLAENMMAQPKINNAIVRQIAQLFQRYNLYDDASKLYLRMREASNNEYLFSQELASVYQAMGKSFDALNEYLNILDERRYKSIKYQVEKLEIEKIELIKALEERYASDPSDELQKMIGEFYVLSENYQKAFEIYSSLGSDALMQLATMGEKQGLYELAIQCLTEVLRNTDDIQSLLYLKTKIGELYYLNNDYEHAYSYYMNVVDLYNNSNATFPSKFIYGAYKNLAFIELFNYKNTEKSLLFLEKALSYASINDERAALSIMLSQCYLQQKDYVKGEQILQEILTDKHYSEEMKDLAKVQLTQTYILKGDFAQADTLSKEFLTHNYESVYVNDISEMYRTVNNELHLDKADDQTKQAAKVLLNDLYFNKIDKLISDLDNLATTMQDTAAVSYMKLQVADYYYNRGDFDNAAIMYGELMADDNSPYTEYMYFRTGNCMRQLGFYEKAIVYYTDYLLSFPQGTFAPEIRSILKRAGS